MYILQFAIAPCTKFGQNVRVKGRAMYPLLTSIFAGALLVTACTKFGKNVTVKGRVLNPVTGQGIAGAKIWLQREQFGFDGGYKTVKEAISDENGYYELDKLGFASYRATCQTGDRYDIGFTTDDGQSFTSNFWLTVKKGKTIKADYYTLDYGLVILDLQNINCTGPTDTAYFRGIHKYFSGMSHFSTPRTGCYIFYSEPFAVPVGQYIFEVKAIRSGVTTYSYDTIFVSGQTPVVAQIYY